MTRNRYLKNIHTKVKTTTESTMRQEKEARESEAKDRTMGNTYFQSMKKMKPGS